MSTLKSREKFWEKFNIQMKIFLILIIIKVMINITCIPKQRMEFSENQN